MIIKKHSLLRDLALLSMILIGGVAVFFINRIEAIQTQVLQHQLDNIASDIDHNYTEIVDYTAHILGYIARQIGQHDDPNDLEYIYTLFKSFRVDPKVRESLSWTIIGWADTKHRAIVDGMLGVMDKPIDLSSRDYIPETVSHPWEIQLGKPVYGSTSNKWIIPAGVGAADAKGNYLGALVIGFEIEKLKERFLRITEGKHVSFALIDRTGDTVLKSSDNLSIAPDILAKVNVTQDVFQLSSDINLLSGRNYYITKLPRYPYAIYLSYEPRFIQKELFKTLKASTFEIAFGVFILWLIIWYFRRQIVLPIGDLSAAANAIAKDESQAIVPRVKLYELHTLAKALTRMKVYKRRDRVAKEKIIHAYSKLEEKTKKLKESSIKLRKSNRELNQTKTKLEDLMHIIRESDKEKELFLQDMYHALNTPLNAIINGADIMRKEQLGPLCLENYDIYLDAMYDAGQQLKTYTTEFLYPEQVNIREVIDKCVIINKKKAAENNLMMEVQVPDVIPPIYADKLRLRQIIVSTIFHAISYTPTDGTVTISASVEKHSDGFPAALIVKVQDNGLGLDEKQRREFVKTTHKAIHKTEITEISRDPDMTRLDFPIIRHLVKLHRGTFEVIAKYAKGTTFLLRLPYLSKDELETHPDIAANREEVMETPAEEKLSNVIPFRQ